MTTEPSDKTDRKRAWAYSNADGWTRTDDPAADCGENEDADRAPSWAAPTLSPLCRELLDHAGNPRQHPQLQRDALRGLLEQVGIAGALIAYHSERNGGKLTLVDGHLRRQDYDLDWPTLILDVTDEEADLLLASHDPLAALAEYDRAKLDGLLQNVRARSPALLAMLKGLAAKTAAGTERGKKDEGVGLPPEKFEIVVECSDEAHQREMYQRLTGEGLRCRVLTF